MLEGPNQLNNTLIDAFISIIILSPFIWLLIKYADRSEKELKENEEEFKILFEGSPDAIFLADPETGLIIDANSRASELLKRSKEEIKGMHQSQLHPPGHEEYSRETFREHAQKTKLKEDIRPFENTVLRSDGTEVPVEVLGRIVTIKGKPVLQGVFRDITERKHAEEALRESKEFSERLIDSMADGLSVLNKDGVRVMVNKALCDMTGFSENELINSKPPFAIWPPEHMKEIGKTFKNMMEGTMGEKELVFIRKTGERFPVLVSPAYMRDKQGRITNFISSIKDITERRKEEEELLKFKLGIERSDEVIFITNIDGYIIYVNPAFEKIYGYSMEEALGKTPRILKSGLLPSEAYKQFWDTLLSKKVVNGELINKTKDGRLLNIGGSANPILDDKGNIIGFLAIQRDISHRKRSEEALSESEERFRKVFEEGPFGMVLTSRDLKFFRVNPAFRQMLGYTEEEMSSKTFLEVTHPEHRPIDRENTEKIWQQKIPYYRTEKRYIKKNGEICWGNLSTTLILGHDGKPLYALAMVEDITMRKLAEEELNKSHKLLSAINRAQSQFITDSDSRIIFEDLLNNLLTLTSSEYGLIGEVLHNTKHEPYLKMHSITNIAWNKDMEEFYEKNAPKGMEFHNLKTLFNAVITTGKPVISNNPSLDPRRGGLPEGHPLINSFMGLPFYRGEKLIGLVGIANRPGGYDEELVEYLKPILNTCANIIEAYRTDQERKRSEEQIKDSLKEKEILLREIHHRVKNNMQIISSLLGLQAESIKEKKYLDMINDSRNRIISMYMIHEKLYRSTDLEKIEITKYIRDLANGLLQSYGVNPSTIELNVNVNDTSLGIDFAIPCGLIINELITNSLKYAFPGSRKGKINVSLHPLDENMFELIVSDNGAGIPHDVDFRKTESLGLRLVTILAENQLQGHVDLNRNGGTEFRIRFKGVKQ